MSVVEDQNRVRLNIGGGGIERSRGRSRSWCSLAVVKFGAQRIVLVAQFLNLRIHGPQLIAQVGIGAHSGVGIVTIRAERIVRIPVLVIERIEVGAGVVIRHRVQEWMLKTMMVEPAKTKSCE